MKYNQGLQELIPFVPQDFAPKQAKWQSMADQEMLNPLNYFFSSIGEGKDVGTSISNMFAKPLAYQDYLNQKNQSLLNQYQDVQNSELKNQQISDKEAIDKLVYAAMQGDKNSLKQIYDIDAEWGMKIENALSLAKSRERPIGYFNFSGKPNAPTLADQSEFIRNSPFLSETIGGLTQADVPELTGAQFVAAQRDMSNQLTKGEFATLLRDLNVAKRKLDAVPSGENIPGIGVLEGVLSPKQRAVFWSTPLAISIAGSKEKADEYHKQVLAITSAVEGINTGIRHKNYGSALTDNEMINFDNLYSKGDELGLRAWIDRNIDTAKGELANVISRAGPQVGVQVFKQNPRALSMIDELWGGQKSFGAQTPSLDATIRKEENIPTGQSILTNNTQPSVSDSEDYSDEDYLRIVRGQ